MSPEPPFIFRYPKNSPSDCRWVTPTWVDHLSGPGFRWTHAELSSFWQSNSRAEFSLGLDFEGEGELQVQGFILWLDIFPHVEVVATAKNPAFKHQKVMETLFQNWINQLSREGFDCIFLEVHPANAKALRLYQRLGFSFDHMRPRYYSDGAPAWIGTRGVKKP